MRTVTCGRIDAHEAHEWTRPFLVAVPRATFQCPGAPEIEGGWQRVFDDYRREMDADYWGEAQ